MEVTAKVLREVEFRDRLRGYDTDEVDEFLEKVAVGVDALNARIEELETRLAAPVPQPEPATVVAPAAPAMDDDAIRRTLVLAQRTADLAVSEAREEAARLVEDAKTEAEGLVARAEEAARRLRAEAEQEVQERVSRLDEERERLERDVGALAHLVEEERERLTESLTSALRFVRETLAVGDETARRAVDPGPGAAPTRSSSSGGGGGQAEPAEPADTEATSEEEPRRGRPSRAEGATPPSAVQPELPDVEAEIHEDAASAAWTPRAEPGGGHVGLPRPIGPRAAEPSGDADAEEALWERWAAGRDLGVVPGPADFSRHPTGSKAQRDRGWSA